MLVEPLVTGSAPMKLLQSPSIFAAILLPGCSVLPPYNDADFGKRSEGSTHLQDTTRNWATTKAETDAAVAAEKAGRPPGRGIQTWEENWQRVFTNIHKGQENPDRYIAYIVEARRAAGLPELSFDRTPRLRTKSSSLRSQQRGHRRTKILNRERL